MIEDWNDEELIGRAVNLHSRRGEVKRGGIVESVYGDYSATVRFPEDDSPAVRYRKLNWTMWPVQSDRSEEGRSVEEPCGTGRGPASL